MRARATPGRRPQTDPASHAIDAQCQVKSVELLPIDVQGHVEGLAGTANREVMDMLHATAEFYRISGFERPWISYLGMADSEIVGICSFKPTDDDRRIEIAYFTFPAFEGNGYATAMATRLISIALQEKSEIRIVAYTRAGANASHQVLKKLGFIQSGPVEHPEEGPVLEWLL